MKAYPDDNYQRIARTNNMPGSLYRGSETCDVCKCCVYYLLSSETKLKCPNKDLLDRQMEIVLAFVESDSASRSFVLRNYFISTAVMLFQNQRNVINCSVTEISVTSTISSPYNPDFFTSCTTLPVCRNISLPYLMSPPCWLFHICKEMVTPAPLRNFHKVRQGKNDAVCGYVMVFIHFYRAVSN